jgi:hypothetical protein
MKKLLIISLLLVSWFSLSQEKKKPLKSGQVDKEVNNRLDSLSKRYKKDVVSYMKKTDCNGKTTRFISHYENNKLVKKEIFD